MDDLTREQYTSPWWRCSKAEKARRREDAITEDTPTKALMDGRLEGRGRLELVTDEAS